MPSHAAPRRTVHLPSLVYSPKRAAGKARALLAAVCSYSPKLPYLSWPDHTAPSRNAPQSAKPKLTTTTLQESSRELLAKLRAAVCSVYPAQAYHAPPHPAWPHRCLPRRKLGLTPKDAQHDQATSASIRFRLSVTGITSVLNRPCLGLQSPRPTSLPASLAISATSPRFSTSGSY